MPYYLLLYYNMRYLLIYDSILILSVKFAVKMAIKSINAQIPDTNALEIVRVRNSIQYLSQLYQP